MKEQISPFSSLISSFVWPLVCFFFFFQRHASNSSDTNKPPECSSYEAVCCHCKPPGVDDQHQRRLRRTEGICACTTGVKVPRGHDLTCLLFRSYTLSAG